MISRFNSPSSMMILKKDHTNTTLLNNARFLQKIWLRNLILNLDILILLVEYPELIGEDNQGAIFLAANLQVSQRTKHIDTKFHFIRKFISTSKEAQHGKLFKIDTKDNTADIGIKMWMYKPSLNMKKKLMTVWRSWENTLRCNEFSGWMLDIVRIYILTSFYL